MRPIGLPSASAAVAISSDVAALLERFGLVLPSGDAGGDLEIIEDRAGHLSFQLLGTLPGEADRARSEIALREEFAPIGSGRYERRRYEYEILDRSRDYRRAFHLHSPDWFERRYLVVVHEHCERPIGRVDCDHYEGSPIKDAFGGVMALMGQSVGAPSDCSGLRCLDEPGTGSRRPSVQPVDRYP